MFFFLWSGCVVTVGISANGEKGKKKAAARAACLQTPVAPVAFSETRSQETGLPGRTSVGNHSLFLRTLAKTKKILPPAAGSHAFFNFQHGRCGERERRFPLRQQRAKHPGTDSPRQVCDAITPGTVQSLLQPGRWRGPAASTAHLLGITRCLCKSVGRNANFI